MNAKKILLALFIAIFQTSCVQLESTVEYEPIYEEADESVSFMRSAERLEAAMAPAMMSFAAESPEALGEICEIDRRGAYSSIKRQCKGVGSAPPKYLVERCIAIIPAEFAKLPMACRNQEKEFATQTMQAYLDHALKTEILSNDSLVINKANLRWLIKNIKNWYSFYTAVSEGEASVQEQEERLFSLTNPIIQKINKNGYTITTKEPSKDHLTVVSDAFKAILEEPTQAAPEVSMAFLNTFLQAVDEKISIFHALNDLTCQFGRCEDGVGDDVNFIIANLLENNTSDEPELQEEYKFPEQIAAPIRDVQNKWFFQQWKERFDLLDNNNELIVQSSSRLEIEFYEIVRKALDRVASRNNAGQNGSSGRPLLFSLASGNSDNFMQYNKSLKSNLEEKRRYIENNQESFFDKLATTISVQRNIINIDEEINLNEYRMLRLVDDLDGLRKGLSDEKDRLAEYMTDIDKLKDSQNNSLFSSEKYLFEQSAYKKVKDTSAKYAPNTTQNIEKLYVDDVEINRSDISANGTQLVTIEIAGEWSPMCAIRKAYELQAPVVVGPEGFFQSHSNSESKITARQNSHSKVDFKSKTYTNSLCVSVEAKGSVGVETGVFGGSSISTSVTASRCMTESVGTKEENVRTESETRQNIASSDARFSGGIRLPDTPFPNLPVGSLIVVVVDKDNPGKVYDMLVGSRNFFYELGPNQKIRFIVNDCKPDNPNEALSRSLEVRAQVSVAEGDLAKEFLDGVADAVKMLQKDIRNIPDGPLSPEYLQVMRNNAFYNAEMRTPQPLNSQPVINKLFAVWVDSEIEQLRRLENIKNLEHEIGIQEIKLRQLRSDKEYTQNLLRLYENKKLQILASADLSGIQPALLRTTEFLSRSLVPLAPVMYPNLMRSEEITQQINIIKTIRYKSKIIDISSKIESLLSTINSELLSRYIVSKSIENTQNIVIKIPKPDTATNEPSEYPVLDPVKSEKIWSTFLDNDVRQLTFELDLNDIYVNEEIYIKGLLNCRTHSPVIKRMLFAFGLANHPTLSPERYAVLNSDPGGISMTMKGKMLFPKKDGVVYALFFKDADDRTSTVPIGFVDSAFPNVAELSRNLADLRYAGFGYSPFATYQLYNLGALRNYLDEQIGMGNVLSLYLLANVETKKQAVSFNGIGTCQ